MKTCTKCKEVKSTTEFQKNCRAKDGLMTRCRTCKNLARKESYYNGSDKGRYHTVRGKCTQHCASAKQRAKKRGLEFNLTSSFLEELWNKQGGKCAITGTEFDLKGTCSITGSGAAVDKIDPTKGYLRDNVQLLCSWVNTMKGARSMDEFKAKVAVLHASL